MQEHENTPEDPSDDGRLAEAFALLRRLQPPLASQIANRAVVNAELRALEVAVPTRPLPWWRRSIAVPVPLAASLLAIVAITVPLTANAWLVSRRTDAPPAALNGGDKQQAGASERAAVASAPFETASRQTAGNAKDDFVTETYLCGVGRVSSHARYSSPENSP